MLSPVNQGRPTGRLPRVRQGETWRHFDPPIAEVSSTAQVVLIYIISGDESLASHRWLIDGEHR